MSYRIRRFTATVDGVVPNPGSSTGKFLKDDGTWAAASGSGGTTTNALTINNSGSGAASGATFNGSAAVTISYNTVGALSSGAVVPAANFPALTGDITTAGGSYATTLANSGVGAGSYTNSSITVDAKGRVTAASSGSPARVLITETVTSGSQANVTFSSVPSTYRHLEIEITGRGDAVAASVNVQLQFNSDTATNYEWEQLNVQGVTSGNGGTTTVAQIVPGLLSGANARASAAGNVMCRIHDYKGTTFHKTTSSFGGCQAGSTGTTMFAICGYGLWKSTSAITDVKVFLSSGNFVNGSVVSLYGLM